VRLCCCCRFCRLSGLQLTLVVICVIYLMVFATSRLCMGRILCQRRDYCYPIHSRGLLVASRCRGFGNG